MFDYITEGPPEFPANPNPSLLLDKINLNLYVSGPFDTNWVMIGTGGSLTDTVQNLTTSQDIAFTGSNILVKATAGVSGITLTLPSAIGLNGISIRIIQVDQGDGGVLINTLLSQTINSDFEYALTNQYQAATFESDGANWFVVSTAN